MLDLERQTIQEANRKEINNENTPFDTVYIKKDTIFYWKDNEYKGMSVFSEGNNMNDKDFPSKLDSNDYDNSNIPFDSIYIKNDTMFYWRDYQFKGKTIIIRK